MTTRSTRGRRLVATVTLLVAALLLTACGDDRATDDAGSTPQDGTIRTPPLAPAPSSSTSGPAASGVVEVELADYSFEGLPESVAVGTRLTVENTSLHELHKLSVLPLPDDEHRSVEELMALPEPELAAILRVRPTTVLTAGPGGPQVEEVGDGTLSEPGRYIVICSVPVGLDPDHYLDALSNMSGRPQMSGGGAPHFTVGMVTDLVVE